MQSFQDSAIFPMEIMERISECIDIPSDYCNFTSTDKKMHTLQKYLYWCVFRCSVFQPEIFQKISPVLQRDVLVKNSDFQQLFSWWIKRLDDVEK